MISIPKKLSRNETSVTTLSETGIHRCVRLEKSACGVDSELSLANNGARDVKGTCSISSRSKCSKRGCSMKSRFDSLFCSDACGVKALEVDLLRSLQYANELYL